MFDGVGNAVEVMCSSANKTSADYIFPESAPHQDHRGVNLGSGSTKSETHPRLMRIPSAVGVEPELFLRGLLFARSFISAQSGCINTFTITSRS